MPKSIAVVVNGNLFVSKPSDSLANILNSLSDPRYHNIAVLCIA